METSISSTFGSPVVIKDFDFVYERLLPSVSVLLNSHVAVIYGNLHEISVTDNMVQSWFVAIYGLSF